MRCSYRCCLLIVTGLCVSVFAQGKLPHATAEDSGSDIVPPGARLEQLWNKGEFTEGVAVAADGTVYFSDIPSGTAPGRIFKFDPKTEKTTVHCADSGKSNGLMFDRNGRLLAACGANVGKRALCEITADGKVRVLAGRYQGKQLNAPNDLVIHPDGDVYFTDPRYVGSEPLELDHMSVYRYSPDGALQRMKIDITKPNGVILSPDARTLYVAETDNGSEGLDAEKPPRPVRMTLNAFRIRDDGALADKRVLVDFKKELGIDGMTVDTRGHIYAAVRSAKRHGIVVYHPSGRELAYIPTEELPTNCCFGTGETANVLYVTIGGGLYRITLNAQGFHPAM